MDQAFITVVVPFPRQNLKRVNDVVSGLADASAGNKPNKQVGDTLDKLGIIHYMSIVAVDPVCPAAASEDPHDKDPEGLDPKDPAHLVFEIVSDYGVEETLTLLAEAIGCGNILKAAGVKWPLRESAAQLLIRHYRRIGADWIAPALGQVHSGSPGMSVGRILRESELATWIADRIVALRKETDWRRSSPRQRLDRIRGEAWAWTHPRWGDTKWAFVEAPAPVLPADPSNPWNDSGYDLRNPQVVKAARWILDQVLWPLYVPFVAIWAILSAPSWLEGSFWHAVRVTVAVYFGLLALVIFAGIAIYARLRRLEAKDASDDRVPPSDQVAKLLQQENFAPGAQNHMTTVSRLKPGWIRRLTLHIAFIVVGSGRFVGAPGFLGKNGVIHFARWMRLPGTSQLMFWSNFDNTWESYVADFIADAPTGVTAIWSNCRGFPQTKNLFGQGAMDRDRLVQWARRQQMPTPFWYSAYPALTADRIRTNAAIRQGLASALSDADARDWLALFGSATRPADALDLTEIPTLVFGGLSNRPFAECHVVQFNSEAKPSQEDELGADDRAAYNAREWLSTIAEDATYGEAEPNQLTVVAVALTASALKILQVPDVAMRTFSPAFQQGIWPSWRARELGDVDVNAPELWKWGGNEDDQRADALVLIYARKPEHLAAKSAEFKKLATDTGHKVIRVIPLNRNVRSPTAPAQGDAGGTAGGDKSPSAGNGADATSPFSVEPFGFADGISQPVIRGAPGKHKRSFENDLVAPGEIVLGYPDNIGTLPTSPSISDKFDDEHYLSDRGTNPFRRRPEFSRYEPSTGLRDLGANGTYLVARQLDQHVDKFNAFKDEAYNLLRGTAVYSDGVSTVVDLKSAAQYAPVGPTSMADSALSGDASTPPLPVGAQGAPAPVLRAVGDSSSSEPLSPEAIKQIKDFIAAKLVGRWQDGSSLVRNPDRPASRDNAKARPDNAFLMGAEDPRGLACPFGSHIRRANPRDTRFHSTPEESRVEVQNVNRHRILRIGRRYDYQDEQGESRTGLLFMCLNADIERQFEFIQKTWILNRNIHSLQDEVDPLVGIGLRQFTIPTPGGPLRLTIKENFVTVTGGGYFFVPGFAALRYLTGGVLPKTASPLVAVRGM
jgi:deferrochelatase/peroxidase EfeB